jgi:hypothetical protein
MPAPITFDDGLLRFTIRNTETGEQAAHSLDVLLLRLTCEECEIQHSLQVNSAGSYVVTAAFLTDLAARMAGLGVPECTASIAYQLWTTSATEIEALKKNTNETPNSPSGSESSQPPTSESAESDSPAPDQTPTPELGSGPT